MIANPVRAWWTRFIGAERRDVPSRRSVISTDDAPAPAASYSQGVLLDDLVFLAGQTPRLPSGERIREASFERQTEVALQNLDAVAHAAGSSLGHALHVTVFLKDPSNAAAFDAVYRRFVDARPPARTLVQSSLIIGEVEVNAICARNC